MHGGIGLIELEQLACDVAESARPLVRAGADNRAGETLEIGEATELLLDMSAQIREIHTEHRLEGFRHGRLLCDRLWFHCAPDQQPGRHGRRALPGTFFSS